MEINEKCVFLQNDKKNSCQANKAPLLKIVLVGDSGVGKTTLITNFINDGVKTEKLKNSIGSDYAIKKIELKRETSVNLRLEIWDTAGNDKFRTMVSTYYRGAHGIIIMFDYTNIKSFYSLKNWMKEIKQFANENIIKYLVGNKIDKVSLDVTSSSLAWVIREEEVERFAVQNSMKCMRTSSTSNIGIKELFISLASDIVDSLDQEKMMLRSDSIKLGYVNNTTFANQKTSEDNNQSRKAQSTQNCCLKN